MAAQTNISWDTVGPFVVWQFLIPLAVGWVQNILYGIFIRAGDPKPQPGSPRFIKHRRRLLIVIYAAYFAFTIYEADYKLQQQSNAYNDLGVAVDVSETKLASIFRKLTVRFHPDKVGPGVDRDRANEHYVHLKHARDIIADPAKRFAYDRFGPDILRQCQNCVTVRDYITHAASGLVGTYGVIFVILIAANALGFLKDGAYWRYLAILALATFEARTAMRPDHPTVLAGYINPLFTRLRLRPAYLPYQLNSLLRKAALSLAQFLGLLIPLYRDDPQKPVKATDDSVEALHKQIDRLSGLSVEELSQASMLLDLETIPYRENDQAKAQLKKALKAYMVQNVVNNEKEVRNAMGRVMERRRAGVPAGARGNR